MNDFVAVECMVRQLHARYADAVWRKDIVAFGDCFTPDAEWRIAGRALRGRAGVTAFMADAFGAFNKILLTMRTPIVSLDSPGEASSRCYFTEDSQFADGRPLASIGVYYDRIVDQGDRWRFASRIFVTEYSGATDFSERFHDNADFGPPPAMPPDDYVPVNHTGSLSDV